MSLNYTKPIWTNDEGTSINAARLQAISDVLDGLVNSNDKSVSNISFDSTGSTMTITFVDGSIQTVSNAMAGPAGPQGEQGNPGSNGSDGSDGFSPVATVTKTGNIATISITDKNGTTTATIRDGSDGQGSGDMLKADYDANDVVKNAGGIVAYIADQIGDIETLLAAL